MQRIVEEVASTEEVPLIDFPKVLKEAYLGQYSHAIFGKEYFVSHVHPTIEGYRLLGLTLLEQMTRQGIATPARSWGTLAMKRVEEEVMSGLDPDAEGLALKKLGKTFNWVGKFDEAHPLFLRALQVLGPDPEIYWRLGTYSILRREYDEAVSHFSQVALLEPNWPDIHYQLARLSVGQGKLDEAIGHFREELLRYPNNHGVHTELAAVLAGKGKIEEAIHHFSEAVRLKPDDPTAKKNLQEALAVRNQ
jgi:tetratricopeptide (TPR) repeat protein